MKTYFKAVILSIKIYENILKLNFLIGVIKHIDCLLKFFLKRSFIDVKNNEGVVILCTFESTLISVNELDAKR